MAAVSSACMLITASCVQVACGGNHTVLLVEGGAVLSWGEGGWGQTGHGSTDNTCYPQRIERLEDITIAQACCCCCSQGLTESFNGCPSTDPGCVDQVRWSKSAEDVIGTFLL